MNGEAFMLWTVRVAVACVYVRFALWLLRNRRGSPSTAECLWWTIGFLFYLAHVVAAFHFIHQWSHDRAWHHTADETARMTGMNRGEGIWVNYAFTLVWAIDVGRLILARLRGRETSAAVDLVSALVFAFICVNATIIFGPLHYRVLAVPAAIGLLIAWRRGAKT